jgi:hypothetical protein
LHAHAASHSTAGVSGPTQVALQAPALQRITACWQAWGPAPHESSQGPSFEQSTIVAWQACGFTASQSTRQP